MPCSRRSSQLRGWTCISWVSYLAGGFFTANDIWGAHLNYGCLLYCLSAFLHIWRQKDFNSLRNTDKAKSGIMRVHTETMGQGIMEVSSEPWKKPQEELRNATCTRRNWAEPSRLCWLLQCMKPKCQSHFRIVSAPTTKPFIQSSSIYWCLGTILFHAEFISLVSWRSILFATTFISQ